MTHARPVALITGATSGIGFHTASGHDGVHFLAADASTVGANQELAHRLASLIDGLDVLVNNVGGTYNERWLTADGYEATLAMNLVGPFSLTQAVQKLLPRGARVVNVASAAIAMVTSDPFADLQSEARYLGSQAYARAKLLNVLWTFALARRLKDSGITANALHPGLAWTTMTAATQARSMPVLMRVLWPLVRLMQRRGSPAASARTPIFLASSPDAAGVTGTYFESHGRPAKVPAAALDTALQERAWAIAEQLVVNAPTASARAEVVV